MLRLNISGNRIALLKTVQRREDEIITRLRGYLEFAEDPEVRDEIEIFIRTLKKIVGRANEVTEAKKHEPIEKYLSALSPSLAVGT